MGRNPFSQSAMYGEGRDFPPLYAPFPGDVVGALPVGLQTRDDNDVPYWPVQSTWTYKEASELLIPDLKLKRSWKINGPE